jgi:hypothetical protein
VSVPLFRFALLAFVALGAACSRAERAPAPLASQKVTEVPAPAGLVAELTIMDPRGLFGALRKLGGSRAQALPSSWELGLFGVLDLPPRVAGFVRPETPVVGVVLAPPAASPAGVIGVRVISGSELVDTLTRGDAALLRAEKDGSSVTLLVGDAAKSPEEDSKPTPALGVVDDWLLVGGDAAVVRSAGAYVARTLGARRTADAPLVVDVNRAALAGPVVSGLRTRWAALRAGLGKQDEEARKKHGRAPDFGDPAAVLGLADAAIDKLLEFVGSCERVRFAMRPEEDHLDLSLSALPRENGSLARSLQALEVGPLDPLLALPKDVLFALLLRSSEVDRRLAADKPADALRSVLGPRLAEKDAAPLAQALRSFHRGRGSVAVGGVFADRSVFLRQEASEPKELERGLRGLLGLLRVPALAEPLEPIVGKLTPRESATRVAGVEGPVHRVELVRRSPRDAGVEVLVHVKGETASIVAAPEANDALVALARGGAETLGRSPVLERLVAGRVPAALALYADLSVMRPGGGPAPALAVLGKRGGDALVEVELSAPACAALVERVGTP